MIEYNFVIMKCTDEESENYGNWLKIDKISKEVTTTERVKKIISDWKDEKAKPVLIEDEQAIAICEFILVKRKEYYEDDLKEELKDFKYQVRNIINDLEELL